MKLSYRLMSIIMAVVMMIGSVSMIALSASTFTDFPAGSWSEAALNAAVANSLIKGRPDNTIAPKDYITRAETATIINRAFGSEVKADISAYIDLSPSDWYYTEIQKAVNMRVIQGVSANLIMPEAYITREQVFAILARALVLSDTDETKLSSFADGGAVSSWARAYAAALVNRGYINGDDNGMLNPGAYITREEFAQVMYNIFKKYIQSEEDGIKDASYGMTLVRGDNLTLKNLVINGDLVVGDGVENIVLDNVKVSGRILFRGGHGKVKIERNCSVGEFVLVNNVNGVVNFDNYETEPIFKNKVLNTKATFLKKSYGGGGGGSYIGEEDYTITIYKQKLTDKAYEDTYTYESETTSVTDTKGKGITYTPATIDGFTVDESISSLSGTNNGSLEIKVYYKRNVYSFTFGGAVYKAYYGQKLGEAGYVSGADTILLADAFRDYTPPAGKTNEGFVVGTTSVDADTVIDETIFATPNVEITPVDKEIFYDIIYDANGGTIDSLEVKTLEDEVGALGTYTLLTTATAVIQKDGFTFGGWYLDKDCQIGPVKTISAGSVPQDGVAYRYYARWIPEGASELGFSFEKDETNKILTVYVTLTAIPKDVNSLSGITVAYSAIPKYATGKKFKFRSAEGIEVAGTKDGFTYSDGKIAWLNLDEPVTEEKLALAGGKLFKLTYEYDDTCGDVVFSYDESKTQLGYYNGYSYELVISQEYSVKDNTAYFDLAYSVTVYEQDIENRPESSPTYIAGTPEVKKDETDKSVDYTSYTAPEGFIKVNTTPSVLAGINNGSLEIKIYLDRKTYEISFNGEVYKFLFGQYLFKGTNGDGDALKKAMDDYIEAKKAEGFDISYTYADGSKIDYENDKAKDGIQGIKITETPIIPDEPTTYRVTLYNGMNDNKGYYDVEAGTKLTQSQVDSVLGSPDTYPVEYGYTDSKGNPHEIRANLWYKVGDDWKVYVPEDVAINKDTDVYLLTSYVGVYYDTDIIVKGYKIPELQLAIPYDTNTELFQSGLDMLTALGATIESVLYDVEKVTGRDLFKDALEKASKLGLTDTEGNILNPEIVVPLSKLITEKRIMDEIDSYIDENIDNEEFIADILRNDHVVDVLLKDDGIKTTILGDAEKRNKLLTKETIKGMLANGSLVDWIIARDDFVETLLEKDATIEYIVDDLENLLNDPTYSDFILNACVEFIIDVYFTEETDPDFIAAPELVKYIDDVLKSPDLIADIEGDDSLKPYFKEEIKDLLSKLHSLPDDDEEKAKVYATIRENEDFRKEIIKALKGNSSVMTLIRNDVRDDLKKATDDDEDTTSKYASVVVNAVREEFATTGSTLKTKIIAEIKTDLSMGDASTLKPTVVAAIEADLAKGDNSVLRPIIVKEIEADIALGDESQYKATIVSIIVDDVALGDESQYKATIVDTIEADLALGDFSEFKPTIVAAIEEDFRKPVSELKDSIISSVVQDFSDPNSKLHDEVIATIKTEIAVADSSLRELILDNFENPSSTRYETIKKHLMGSAAIRDEIKLVAKDNTDVQASAKTFLTTEANLTDSLKAEMLGAIKTDASALVIVIKSADSSITDADGLAQDYIKGNLGDTEKAEIDGKIGDFFEDTSLLASTIDSNFDTIYSVAYDDLFDNMYTNDDVFDSAYAIYASNRQNLEKAFDSYVGESDNLDEAIESFVSNEDDLEEAVIVYATSNVSDAVDLYIGISGNISEAIGYYIKDEGRVSDAADIYISDETRLSDAIDFCLDNGTGLSEAIDLYIKEAEDTDIEKAINIYIDDNDSLLRAVNNYIAEDEKLIEVFGLVEADEGKLMDAFEVYVAADPNADDEAIAAANDNLDSAFKKLTESDDFDTFYDTYFGGEDSTLFNKVFEIYYLANVHHAAQVAYDNENFNATVMSYVETYTLDLLKDYASGALALSNKDLSDAIDALMADEFPDIIRDKYENDGTIKDTVDTLVSSKGRELIVKYTNGTLGNDDLEALIDSTVQEKVNTVVDEYINGELGDDIKAIVDSEINEYTRKLVDDYINDEGDARETLGELIPTYAHTAVDALKATDGFKNTITDFTSGKDVRVNESNIMFISIISELMGEYDYDKIMKDFAPEELVKLIDKLNADEVARKYVNDMLNKFVEGVKSAEEKLNKDIEDETEGTEYTFTTNIPVTVKYMSDIVIPAYDKAMARLTGKLKSKELITKNPLAMELVDKNWILEILDYDPSKVSETMTGYSLKKGEYDAEYDDYGSPIMTYYNIFLDNAVLLHDAVMWYGDNLDEVTIKDKLEAVSLLIGTYANKANDVIMEYINTGRLPKGYTPEEIATKILDRVLGVNSKVDTAYEKIEDFYFANEEKILSYIDRAKKFYEENLDRDYEEIIDLANMTLYADGKAYPIYKTLLEMHGEDEAFNIDALAYAVFDSDNYFGINKVETLMSKLKNKLSKYEDNPVSEIRIFRNAYKASFGPREVKDYNTGIHTAKLQRFLR